MTGRFLRVGLLALLLAVSVQNKPRGKHESFSKQPSKVEDAESPGSSDGEGAILPTSFSFEASSPDAGDEDTLEDVERADTGVLQASDGGERNTLGPVLLNEEELIRLLQGADEEEQPGGENPEGEDEEEVQKENARDEVRKQEAMEVRSSRESEIPIEEANAWTSETEEVGEELPTAMADYDFQQTDYDSQETDYNSQKSEQESEEPFEGSQETDQAVSVYKDEQTVQLWDTEERAQRLESVEIQRKKRKNLHMMKVQKISQGDQVSVSEESSGHARRREPEEEPEEEPDSKLNTERRREIRRRRKRIPLVGLTLVPDQAGAHRSTSTRSKAHPVPDRQEAPANPCKDFPCKQGRMCETDEQTKPSCVCQDPAHCPDASPTDLRPVCGTDNQTYQTSCQLFATKCHLEDTKKGHQLHLDYIGPCKFIPPCLNTELLQFPLRMREWLKNVLLQLYEHDSVTPGLLTSKQRSRVQKLYESERRLHMGPPPIQMLLLDFEKNSNLYIYPVHWQFAQLDLHPTDRVLTHSELAPLRAPLFPMEHCTSLFFRECDTDADSLLSLAEWCLCFGLRHEDVDSQLLF